MLEAGIVSFVFAWFVDHPGLVVWILLFAFVQRLLFYKTYTPYGLTFFLAGAIATLVLGVLSSSLFNSFTGAFTDLARR